MMLIVTLILKMVIVTLILKMEFLCLRGRSCGVETLKAMQQEWWGKMTATYVPLVNDAHIIVILCLVLTFADLYIYNYIYYNIKLIKD